MALLCVASHSRIISSSCSQAALSLPICDCVKNCCSCGIETWVSVLSCRLRTVTLACVSITLSCNPDTWAFRLLRCVVALAGRFLSLRFRPFFSFGAFSMGVFCGGGGRLEGLL